MAYEGVFNQIIENEFFQKNPNKVDIFLKYITARIDIKNLGAFWKCDNLYTPHNFLILLFAETVRPF